MSGTPNNIAESANNVTEAPKKTSKINTNVIFTDFEKEIVSSRLTGTDDEGNLTRPFNEKSVYGMTKYVREYTDEETDEEKTENIKFLSVKGRFKNKKGSLLSVTIVVVADYRFYMSLDNREDKDAQSQFVNDLWTMHYVLDNMQDSSMSQEEIDAERKAVDEM